MAPIGVEFDASGRQIDQSSLNGVQSNFHNGNSSNYGVTAQQSPVLQPILTPSEQQPQSSLPEPQQQQHEGVGVHKDVYFPTYSSVLSEPDRCKGLITPFPPDPRWINSQEAPKISMFNYTAPLNNNDSNSSNTSVPSQLNDPLKGNNGGLYNQSSSHILRNIDPVRHVKPTTWLQIELPSLITNTILFIVGLVALIIWINSIEYDDEDRFQDMNVAALIVWAIAWPFWSIGFSISLLYMYPVACFISRPLLRLSDYLVKCNPVFDHLCCVKYCCGNLKHIKSNDIINIYQQLDQDIPELYLVINTFKDESLLKNVQKVGPGFSSYEPSPSGFTFFHRDSGYTHIYPLGISAFANTTLYPDNSNNYSQSIGDFSYTYTLSQDDQEWLNAAINDLKQRHTTQQYPLVIAEVRYMLRNTTETLITDKLWRDRLHKVISYQRYGYNMMKRLYIPVSSALRLDESIKVSEKQLLYSTQSYGKADYLTTIDHDSGMQCLSILLACIAYVAQLRSLFSGIFKSISPYIWFIHNKHIILSRNIYLPQDTAYMQNPSIIDRAN